MSTPLINRSWIKASLLMTAWLLASQGQADDSDDATLAALKNTLAAIAEKVNRRGDEGIAFRESRDSELLDAPVVYYGELKFDAATGTLTKIVSAPVQARMAMTTTQLILTRPGKKDRRVALARRPALQALHAGLSALLAGDAAALSDVFSVEFFDGPQWELRLTPTANKLRYKIASITVLGRDADIHSLTSELVNGETQVIDFDER